VAALERTGADVVGGNMTPEGRSPFGQAVAVATSTPMGVGGSRFHYAAREEPSESVYMGTFRRDVFARFGGFDEGLVRNQDDEFNYRVREKGGRVWLVPSMRSRYFPRETPAALFRQYLQYGIYKVRVTALHPRMLRPRHLAPSAFVGAAGLLLLAAPFSSTAAVALAGLLAIHASASLALSREARRRPGIWMRVPVVNLILHTAYGAGFLGGCLAAAAGRPPGTSPRTLRSAP
jgi:GT2 family glycosyltransferase